MQGCWKKEGKAEFSKALLLFCVPSLSPLSLVHGKLRRRKLGMGARKPLLEWLFMGISREISRPLGGSKALREGFCSFWGFFVNPVAGPAAIPSGIQGFGGVGEISFRIRDNPGSSAWEWLSSAAVWTRKGGEQKIWGPLLFSPSHSTFWKLLPSLILPHSRNALGWKGP